VSAPAEARPFTRTDRREAELHQVAAGNRDHWEGCWTDRLGEPVVKHASAAMRELIEAGLTELELGPVAAHYYVRLTAEGTATLQAWTKPRRRWTKR